MTTLAELRPMFSLTDVGEVIRRIITCGPERVFIQSTLNLYPLGNTEHFTLGKEPLVITNRGTIHNERPCLVMAQVNSGCHALGIWDEVSYHEQSFALANGEEVTSITQDPVSELILVGLKTGLKMFRLDPVRTQLQFITYLPTEQAVESITMNHLGPDYKSSIGVKFFLSLKDRTEISLLYAPEGLYRYLDEPLQHRTFAITKGIYGLWRIFDSSMQLNCYPSFEKSVPLDQNVKDACFGIDARNNTLHCILFDSGDVCIGNTVSDKSPWRWIKGQNIQTIALQQKWKSADLFLATNNEVFSLSL